MAQHLFRNFPLLLILGWTVFWGWGCENKFLALETIQVHPETEQITFDRFNYQDPAWSPDGRSIAFSRRGNLIRLSALFLAGESTYTLAKFNGHFQGRVAISPNGHKLVYQSAEDSQLWLQDLLTTETIDLIPDDYHNIFDPDFSADGNTVAFISRSGWEYRLMVIPSQGGKPRIIYATSQAFLSWPSWSPDGAWIACSCAPRDSNVSRIVLIRLLDGFIKTLTGRYRLQMYPDWSPDGQRITFYAYDSSSHISFIDPSGENLNVFLQGPEFSSAVPLWSPDGAHLAIVTYRQMLIYGQDGTVSAQIAFGHRDQVQWLPDGRILVCENLLGQYQIGKIDIATRQITPLTDFTDAVASQPSWFPDNSALVFVRENSGLQKIPAHAPGQIQQIFSGYCRNPQVSPDGQQILFDDGKVIYMLKLTDQQVSQISRPNENLYAPDWSPDQQKFVCCSRNSLFVFKKIHNTWTQDLVLPGYYQNVCWPPVTLYNMPFFIVEYFNNIRLKYYPGNRTKLLVYLGWDACLSPDGAYLAYVTLPDFFNYQIFVKKIIQDFSENQ